MRSSGLECLSWVNEAEKALRRAEYERAATLLRRVTAFLWATRDMEMYPQYAKMLCDCYLAAAQAGRSRGDIVHSASFYRAAATCLQNLGDEAGAAECRRLVDDYYEGLLRSGFSGVDITPKELKSVGDYLKASSRRLDAAHCYMRAAEAALRTGRPFLAAGLFRDAGDTYREADELKAAVEGYERAADLYTRCELDFESAWHLTLASFIQTSLGDKAKAVALAERALRVSAESGIPVLINELASTARSLAQGNLVEAIKAWGLVRRKLTPSYASVVEKSFSEVNRTIKGT